MNIFENNPGAMFFLGMAVMLLVGVAMYIVIKNSKHRCQSCGGATIRYCFMYQCKKVRLGLFEYEVYVFRTCKCSKCRPQVKKFIRAYTPAEIAKKNPREFDIGGFTATTLFNRAGIQRPAQAVLSDYKASYSTWYRQPKGPYRADTRPVYKS